MEGRSDVGVYGTVSFATPFHHAAIRDDRKVMASNTGIANLGMGDDSNCGGGETATQEEGRTLAAFGVVGGGLAAILLAQLRRGQGSPVGIRAIEQRADRGIGQSVRTQFRLDAGGPVALPHPRAHDHFTKAVIVLVLLLLQRAQRGLRFLLVAPRMFQPRPQLTLRVFAPGEHPERTVVGAAISLAARGSGVATLPHARNCRSAPARDRVASRRSCKTLRLDFFGIF